MPSFFGRAAIFIDHPFVRWNQRLLESFFSPASQGQEVWLHVTASELDALGPDLGGDAGFKRAVLSGPPWEPPTPRGPGVGWDFSVCAYRLAARRRLPANRRLSSYIDPGRLNPVYVGCNAPTYLPFLAVLVRSAAEQHGQGFYAHLHEEGIVPHGWNSVDLKEVNKVWDDLEAWTSGLLGRFGKFRVRQLGGYNRIGVPRSQSIVSRRDADLLSRVFARLGARPGAPADSLNPRQVLDCIKDSHFLSRPLREAVADVAFADVALEKVRAIFEDWDGTVEIGQAAVDQVHASGTSRANKLVALCLSLGAGGEPPWSIGWRSSALLDAGRLTISRGGCSWVLVSDGTNPCSSLQNTDLVAREAAVAALRDSQLSDIVFEARFDKGAEETGEAETERFIFPSRILRTMAFEYELSTGEYELRERALPLNGPGYFLADPENSMRLIDYLFREGIDHEVIDYAGLPRDWVLVCAPRCEEISAAQRDTLPDGEQGSRAVSRSLRLVGGRSVNRGGTRQYFSYDLPRLELDAPEGTVVHANGIDFREIVGHDSAKSALRQFEIIVRDGATHCFVIWAMRAGGSFAEVRLRIATEQGAIGGQQSSFSLDPHGVPSRDTAGLRGILHESARTVVPPVSRIATDPARVSLSVTALALADHLGAPATQFLDALAKQGCMGYGIARDLLARLLARRGSHITPSNILLGLRSRGHLEIETNAKGQMAKIHAVSPRLVCLPVGIGRSVWFGVQGSLELAQWRVLNTTAAGRATFRRAGTTQLLQDWVVRVDGPEGLEDMRCAGFEIVDECPAASIAAWSAGVHEVLARLSEHAVEDLGKRQEDVARLVPKNGQFSPCPGDLSVGTEIRCKLFRMKDLDTGHHQVYALGTISPGGIQRYSFVRDSRWGVWSASLAFADFVKGIGIHDASPWPVPYLEHAGTVLLPARMSLPVTLERALSVCSGAAPEAVEVVGELCEAGVLLRQLADGHFLGTVSRVYAEMSSGRWLAYHWVPREVIELVAEKLGGTVQIVG